MSDSNNPMVQSATTGPAILARTQQVQDDAFLAGVLYARLVRRGYRDRAERAVFNGDGQGLADLVQLGNGGTRGRLL